MPDFLQGTKQRYLLNENKEWTFSTNRLTKSNFIDLIYGSNMIVYGDVISKYCSELLKKETDKEFKVFVVRSNTGCTFSDTKGNIFISSGIISRLTDESQLLFFLFRETLRINNGTDPIVERKNDELSFSKIIEILSKEEINLEIELDKKAWDFIQKRTNASNSSLTQIFDILFYQDAPFYEKKFDWNYFNKGQLYIPPAVFLNNVNPKPIIFNPRIHYPLIQSRKDTLQKTVRLVDVIEDKSIQQEGESINEIVKLARLETIQLNLINGNFHRALYEIYILESFNIQNRTIDYMKAYAWLCILKEKKFEINPIKHSEYEVYDNEGAFFNKVLRRQSTEALLAIALRIVKDLKEKNNDTGAFVLIYNDLIRIASNSPEFKLNNFSITKKTEGEFDSKREQLENSQIGDTLKTYHNYIIGDLVGDPYFLNLYNSYKNVDSSELNVSKIEILNFDIAAYKRNSINQKKTEKLKIEEIISPMKRSNLSFTQKVSSWTTEDYNEKYFYSSAINQNYRYSNYSLSTLPFFFREIASNSDGTFDRSAIFIYKHQYRLKLKGLQFLAFFVVPIPYLIPEFFYSSNRSVFSGFYFDPKTGNIENPFYWNYHDPNSTLLLKNNLYNTTMKNYIKL